MKFGSLASRPIRKLLIMANGAFWLLFGSYFGAQSYTYRPHTKVFEEETPPYIFWGRAFPFEQYMNPVMRATRFIQAPSFYAARPFFSYFDKRGIVVDHTYWGISIGGYYLIVVCLLSFLQWYLVGVIVEFIRPRIKRSGETPHTTT